MNESIFFRYIREGKQVPVTKFVPGRGIELGDESGAPLIGVRFSMAPDDTATRDALKRTLPLLGMQGLEEFRVKAELTRGGIRVTGIRADITSLPPGTYRINIELADTKLERIDPVTVKKGKETSVDVVEKLEKRVFSLIDDENFEPSIWAILNSSESMIDGQPAMDWLKQPERRVRRKACLLNLMAKLRFIKEDGVPLARLVTSVKRAEIDRIYTAVSSDLIKALRKSKAFKKDSGPLAGVHLEIAHGQLGDAVKNYDLVSFREDVGRRSAQIIVSEPKNAADPHFAEMDIDVFNPGFDLSTLFGHVGELLDSGKTDHVQMFDALKGDGLSDFLYYTMKPRAAAAGR